MHSLHRYKQTTYTVTYAFWLISKYLNPIYIDYGGENSRFDRILFIKARKKCLLFEPYIG